MEKELGANLFESVPLDERKADKVKAIAEQAAILYQMIEACGKSREISLAITNLEQTLMWANKGISRSP